MKPSLKEAIAQIIAEMPESKRAEFFHIDCEKIVKKKHDRKKAKKKKHAKVA
jgi:hypothetical protein